MMTRVLAAALLTACASTAHVPLDTAFTLQHGQTVSVGSAGMTLTFVDVADSRCPRNATCVWAGEVTVELEVGTETVKVKVPGAASIAGHVIEVRDVTPYPDDPPPPKKAYAATVVVTRTQG